MSEHIDGDIKHKSKYYSLILLCILIATSAKLIASKYYLCSKLHSRPQSLMFSLVPQCTIKIFRGGRGGDPFKQDPLPQKASGQKTPDKNPPDINPRTKTPWTNPLAKNPRTKTPRQNILFRNFITFVFRMSYGKEISIWFLALKYIRNGSIK